jgi:outer membrane protein TolC
MMRRPAAVAATAMLLAGCATFSNDGGMGEVAALTRERTGQGVALQLSAAEQDSARARVAELLQSPLGADAAVELALLNNRGLQASLAELGIAEADLVRAGRLRNPAFGFGRLRDGTGAVEIERSVVVDVLQLLTMPLAREVEQRRFAQARLQAANEAVGLAGDVRRAYFDALAAQELVGYFARVKDAVDASSELARRMLQAGNFNRLEQLRQQAFYADATAQLARAQHQRVAERERLTRLLGLDAADAFQLPERLPDLPAQPTEPKDAEQTAMDQRLDVLMARRSTEATARALGLTRATRFVNVLELGYQDKRTTGETRASGYQIEFELPLFDFGESRVARADAVYRQALHRAAEVALNARSQVREAYSAYRTAYDLARHYRDEVLPLQKRISEENLLRYNGMLIGVFELLADAREQVSSVTRAVEALRDHWVAETNLGSALTGRMPVAGAALRRDAGTGPSEAAGH